MSHFGYATILLCLFFTHIEGRNGRRLKTIGFASRFLIHMFTFYYTGWLIGILIMAYYDPYIAG